jgi:hypothetical protein
VTIYKRKSHDRWVGCLTLESDNRKYYYGNTQKEVKEKLTEGRALQQRGRLANGPSMIVSRFLSEWLEDVKKPRIRYRSYLSYQADIGHLVPLVGHHRLSSLKPEHLQSACTALLGDLSSTSVRHIHTTIRQAFKHAVEWDPIPRNPADFARPPRRQKQEMPTLSADKSR